MFSLSNQSKHTHNRYLALVLFSINLNCQSDRCKNKLLNVTPKEKNVILNNQTNTLSNTKFK